MTKEKYRILHEECRVCRKTYMIKVKEKDLVDFLQNGKHAQKAFPYLREGERELLISGTCDKCWDDFFGKEEENKKYPF